jgi:hypothetical protein
MQAQLLPILLLTIPLALCVICFLGRPGSESKHVPVRSVGRPPAGPARATLSPRLGAT